MDRKQFKERCRRIAEDVIEEGFPELRGSRIFFFRCINPFEGLFIYPCLIGVNKDSVKYSDSEFKGILAHEICHMKLCKDYGFLKTSLMIIKYYLNSSFRKREEIKTDKETIKRGFAKELALFSRRLENKYPKSKNLTYWSEKNIKSYAKKIGKW